MNKAEAVLAEIFDPDVGWNFKDEVRALTRPSFQSLNAFAELIATTHPEEVFQSFLEEHPGFLASAFGWSDEEVLAFVVKPRVGPWNADFAVLLYGQCGCIIHLIELETPDAILFTKKNTPARKLQTAFGQVQDWHEWIRPNEMTFIRDTLRLAQSSPLYPSRKANGSFRLRSMKDVDQIWRGFRGYEFVSIQYEVIIGRWGALTEQHRQRLILNNQTDRFFRRIRTYDELIRRAFARPYCSAD